MPECILLWERLGFPDGSDSKESAAIQETRAQSWAGKTPWRRAWQPTPAFFPGEFYGQRSLVGYSPWSRKKVGHNWATNTFTREVGYLWMGGEHLVDTQCTVSIRTRDSALQEIKCTLSVWLSWIVMFQVRSWTVSWRDIQWEPLRCGCKLKNYFGEDSVIRQKCLPVPAPGRTSIQVSRTTCLWLHLSSSICTRLQVGWSWTRWSLCSWEEDFSACPLSSVPWNSAIIGGPSTSDWLRGSWQKRCTQVKRPSQPGLHSASESVSAVIGCNFWQSHEFRASPQRKRLSYLGGLDNEKLSLKNGAVELSWNELAEEVDAVCSTSLTQCSHRGDRHLWPCDPCEQVQFLWRRKHHMGARSLGILFWSLVESSGEEQLGTGAGYLGLQAQTSGSPSANKEPMNTELEDPSLQRLCTWGVLFLAAAAE